MSNGSQSPLDTNRTSLLASIQDSQRKFEEKLASRPGSAASLESAKAAAAQSPMVLTRAFVGRSPDESHRQRAVELALRRAEHSKRSVIEEHLKRTEKLEEFMQRAVGGSSSSSRPSSSNTMSYSPTAGANGNNNNSKSNNSAGAGETAAAAEARLRMTVSAANSPAGTAFLTSTQPLPTSSRQTMAAATAGNRHQGDDPLLEHDWRVYYDRRGLTGPARRTALSENYEANLLVVGEFKSIRGFWQYVNNLKPPSQMESNCNLHIFRSGIKPTWEDPVNSGGGKWTLELRDDSISIDDVWVNLLMAVAGERLDDGDEVCGLVMSRRPKGDRIALWVKSANKDNQLLEIGRRMLEELNLMTANIELNFQPHSQAIRTGSSYSSGKSRLSLEAVRSLKLKN